MGTKKGNWVYIKHENKEKLSWGKRSKQGGEGRGANPNNIESIIMHILENVTTISPTLYTK